MLTKAKRRGSRVADSISTQAPTLQLQLEDSTHDEEIRLRAYAIYLQRGRQQGCELDDWLEAERQIERRALERDRAS